MKKFDVLARDNISNIYYSTRVQAENKTDAARYALDYFVILDKVDYENMSIIDVKKVRQHT